MLEKFAELEKVQKKVSRGFAQMGISVHTLQQKIALLKAERDLLPIGSLSAIRKYNSEINKLEHSVSKLQTLNGSKLKTWFSEVSRPKNGLHLFCQFNLCFSFFKLSIVSKNSFTTSV